MPITRSTIILTLSIAAITLGYYYYQSGQSVVEIKPPNNSGEKR